MHSKFIFLSFFICLFFFGCSLMPNEIRTAEKVMDTNPDSALQILKKMHPVLSLSNADRALYGIILFQALDKSNKPLQPDSVLNFSIKYYQNSNDTKRLALAYYFKAKLYKKSQQLEQATVLYLRLLDMIPKKNNFVLLGKINSDLGDICVMQADFKNALVKHQISYDLFVKSGDTTSANYKLLDIGKDYRLMKNHNFARLYYNKLLANSKDSFLHGFVYQEMGINFYDVRKFDSAEYFLRKSLKYPFKGTNYSIRNYVLADLYFDMNKYDSSTTYALNSLKYPANYVTRKECYRILVNSRYSLNDLGHVALYMSKYQDYTDSVRKIENQTKTSILEDLHETSGTVSKFRQFLFVLGLILIAVLGISLLIVFTLRNRAKKKQKQLEMTENKLTEKQIFLKDSLILKIEENRMLQADSFKKANLIERESISKDIFNISLHLNDWNAFESLMNKIFNNLVTVLQNKSSEINHKEIIWCCLFLLDVPTNDIIILLDCQQRSLYKMKQRLTQKLHLTTTTELENLLIELSEDK